MKTVVVISGKGGTGKTTVVASLAKITHQMDQRVVLADADVDASNLSLLLHPKAAPAIPFIGGEMVEVDPEACNGCGLCIEHCRFDALQMIETDDGSCVQVKEMSCEGCAVCTIVCPEKALSMHDDVTGEWTLTTADTGPLVFAHLGVSGENSGRLVTHVRSVAAAKAEEIGADILLIDGPPGTGCPVISAVTGVDLVLLVTEPTPPGISDLNRVLALARHFGIQAAVVINKADLNPSLVRELRADLVGQDVEVLGEIPYDEAVPRAQRLGVLPIDAENVVGQALRHIQNRLMVTLDGQPESQRQKTSSDLQQEARQ
ncbi:MAG: ATP-binding protein [Thermoanaerobaculales bacterium]|nr:ATP-binding protein [Thermoanaerobaculales bacterium]